MTAELNSYSGIITGMVKGLLPILIFASTGFNVRAQNKPNWNGKKCAVCLTYDDALDAQLKNVVPLLDSLDLNGTFYLPGYFEGFKNNIDKWRAVVEDGNELGNHTLYHPCDGRPAGRDFVQPDYDLSHYTVQRMMDEIQMDNVLLKAVDGKSVRTFAYPCGDTKAGDSSYVNAIKKDFVAARGVVGRLENINSVNLFDIGSYMINGETGDQLIELVKKAEKKNALLVFLFHGVGGGHSINVSLRAHSVLLHYLKAHENQIWVTPLVDAAEYIKEYRAERKK